MNYKKPFLVAGAASTITLAAATGLGVASAATDTSASSTDPTSSLVSKIAAKFKLNKADVQAVVDEDRAAHDAERDKQTEATLTQAVTDGKITSDQKTKIIAKLKELKTQREANRSAMSTKTEAERKAAMDAERTALKTWASDNNIPIEYLRLGMGRHGGHDGLRADKPADTVAPSTSTN